jgi:predicted ATPase/DNA-binding SARP family transcriptional activator
MPHTPAYASNRKYSLEARLLGGCALRYQGRPVPTTAFKRRRSLTLLLFLLSISDRQASRHTVLELLWPDKHIPDSENGLRVVLSDLRAGFGESSACSPIKGHGPLVSLHPDIEPTIDADIFEAVAGNGLARHDPEALREAASLYTGAFLPDRPYDDWAIRRRERLSRLHEQVLAQLVGLEQRDDPLAAEGRLRALLAAEPTNEGAARRLIKLLAGQDRRAEALRAYQALTIALRDELDVTPAAATERLRVDLFGADPLPSPMPAQLGRPVTLTNVPTYATSFVGREWELTEVKGLLLQPPSGCRLLTLTGPGGCGKTRLAIEVANATAPHYSGGVRWGGLAELTDADLLPRLIAEAIGLGEAARGVQSEDTLIEALHHKRMVLVLDNCEHLIEPVATLATTLLRGCPQLQILATSREALAIAGEITWLIPPLGLPPELEDCSDPVGPTAPHSPSGLVRYGAIRLFSDQARASMPGFALVDQNAAIVVAICRRLGGIPVAIELAAAQLRTLTVAELAAQLDDQFLLCESGDPAALPRHRTLRAVMDWSYSLLDESERVLLQRLSVFSGGWTAEEAEAVCAGGVLPAGEVAPCLFHLVEKSLVTVEEAREREPTAPTRYHMLETVRRYARARLDALTLSALRRTHADYYPSPAKSRQG